MHIAPPEDRFYSSLNRKPAVVAEHLSKAGIGPAFDPVVCRRHLADLCLLRSVQISEHRSFFQQLHKRPLRFNEPFVGRSAVAEFVIT